MYTAREAVTNSMVKVESCIDTIYLYVLPVGVVHFFNCLYPLFKIQGLLHFPYCARIGRQHRACAE